eukprot:263342_1
MSTSVIIEEEEKYDTEYKHNQQQYQSQRTHIEICTHTNSFVQNSNERIQFVAPRESDYIDCQNIGQDIDKCNVIKRIIWLLIYYQHNKNANMYEYMSSNSYGIHIFMEDWYQA